MYLVTKYAFSNKIPFELIKLWSELHTVNKANRSAHNPSDQFSINERKCESIVFTFTIRNWSCIPLYNMLVNFINSWNHIHDIYSDHIQLPVRWLMCELDNNSSRREIFRGFFFAFGFTSIDISMIAKPIVIARSSFTSLVRWHLLNANFWHVFVRSLLQISANISVNSMNMSSINSLIDSIFARKKCQYRTIFKRHDHRIGFRKFSCIFSK